VFIWQHPGEGAVVRATAGVGRTLRLYPLTAAVATADPRFVGWGGSRSAVVWAAGERRGV